MPDIRSVAVFCGARAGDNPVFAAGARSLGASLAERGIQLVYGGGRVGLMGAVADGAIAAGGKVIGVIPDFLTRLEVAHDGVSELVVTDSMHSRKHRMFELSDAFITLAGGLGTLDETFEILTWKQLGLHAKPVLICDIAGSAKPLVDMIDFAIGAGFAKPEIGKLYELVHGVEGVMFRLNQLSATGEGLPNLL